MRCNTPAAHETETRPIELRSLSWLTRERPDLAVAIEAPTREKLGIAYAPKRVDVCEAVDAEIEALGVDGAFAELKSAWLEAASTRPA